MHFITATQIHDGRKFLEGHPVLALDDRGTIKDILPLDSLDPLVVSHHDGILCPGFVNAHCHLELSHMSGLIPKHTGLIDFALHIIKNRNATPVEEIMEKAMEANKQMWDQGIVAVGDISNTTHSISAKQNPGIHYHSFIELIGLNPARAEQVFTDGGGLLNEFTAAGLAASLAPHAPYTVSYRLMELIAQQHSISSIHNQESRQEDLFFENKSGDVLKLYSSLNIPVDHFNASGRSSLQSYLPHLSAGKELLLVHNTFSSAEDIAFAEHTSKQVYWCLCPNANLYIENKLPPADLLEAAGSRICLGTDSLASNHDLSILGEMQVVAAHFPAIPLEKLIRWATFNGASALGIAGRYGLIEKNRAPGINLISGKHAEWRTEKLF